MKTFEELIEEVYHDEDLRLEFTTYAQLKRKHHAWVQYRQESMPAVHTVQPQFLRYDEIIQIQPDVPAELVQLNRGINFLMSSLFRTLAHRYFLDADDAKKLREAVAARYAQGLDKPQGTFH